MIDYDLAIWFVICVIELQVIILGINIIIKGGHK